MKKLFLLIAILLLTTTIFAEVTTKTFEFESFNALEISSCFKINIVKSNEYKVEITIDKEAEKYLDIEVINNTLSMGINSQSITMRRDNNKIITITNNNSYNDNLSLNIETLEATIYLPEIEKIEMSGATAITSDDTFEVNDFYCELSGASELNMSLTGSQVNIELSGASNAKFDLDTDDLKTSISGASNLEITGEANSSKIQITGASELKAENCSIETVDIEISGASTATITVEGDLDVQLSGLSKLYYKSPETISIRKEISRLSELIKL